MTNCRSEKGQAIILLAFAVVAMLAFTALAIDIGIIWVTKSQLQNACDSAALASAVEMPNQTEAGNTALEYLRLHNIVEDNQHDIIISYPTSLFDNKVLVQVSKKCNLFFAPILGRKFAVVQAEAEAEYVATIYLAGFTSRDEYGIVGLVNYSVFGYHAKREWGDPYSTRWNWGTANPYYSDDGYLYVFEATDRWVATNGPLIQVEIFDPDSYNKYDVGPGLPEPSEPWQCPGKEEAEKEVVHSKEWSWVKGGLGEPKIPIRVDELWEANGMTFHDNTAFTRTRYTLYSPDGEEIAHAEYDGLNPSPTNDELFANTDLHWVTPSEYAAEDGTRHCPVCSFFGSFLIDTNEYGTGTYVLRVQGIYGSSGQYYNLRVGSPHHGGQPVPHDVWGIPQSEQIYIFGVGRMLINFNTPYAQDCDVPIDISLGWIPKEVADAWVYIDKFDTDIGTDIRLTYRLFRGANEHIDDEWPWEGTRTENNTWTNGGKPDRVHIPENWGGGYLRVTYQAANTDTTCWRMWIEGSGANQNAVIRLTK